MSLKGKWAIFRKLAAYLDEHKMLVVLGLLLCSASAGFTVAAPLMMGEITNAVFDGSTNGRGIDFAFIRESCIILAVIYATCAVFDFFQGYITSSLSQKIARRMRSQLMKKIGKMPLATLERCNHGDLLSRLTNDVDTLSDALSSGISSVVSMTVALTGTMIAMLNIQWILAVSALVVMPLSLIVISAVMQRSQKHFVGYQEALGNMNGFVEEAFTTHETMKAYNGEDSTIQRFSEHNETLCTHSRKAQFFSGIMQPIMSVVGNLSFVIVAVLGGWFAILGKITVGGIQAFIQYVNNFMQSTGEASEVSGSIQQTLAAAERVFEVLEADEEPADAEDAVWPERLTGGVSLQGVRFGYSEDSPVLQDINLDVPAGNRVAIVGSTGAGKTTLAKLLLRFYDVTDGSVRVDGKDIRAYSRAGFRSRVGVVLQDAWLFCGTIKENIRYNKLDATDEEVYEAARAAHADRFIRALPGGYDMELTENGENLSIGERQLITIARALLTNPDILILDEATSSVDTRTEVLLQKAMMAATKNRTCFIIAHRLSTIRDADMILVMDEGRIVEQGRHRELLEREGHYARLHNSQFAEALS